MKGSKKEKEVVGAALKRYECTEAEEGVWHEREVIKGYKGFYKMKS